MISIVRLIILLKLNHESRDLDHNYVSLSSWSIAESNMAIVAGEIPMSSLQKLLLKLVTACLPSLHPALFRNPRNEPQPLTRSASGENFRRSRPLGHSPVMVQPHEQSTIVSKNQHDFSRLPDEAYGYTEKGERYGTAFWARKDRKLRDPENHETQKGSRPAKSKRQSHIHVETTISTT